MEKQGPVYYQQLAECVDGIIEKVGKKIVLGMPLALGKPNPLANELYRRAKEDPSLDLTIITALPLEKPTWSSDLERRLVETIAKREWPNYPSFEFIADLRADILPPNVKLLEFFSKAGGYLGVGVAQKNHISSNYTHAVRDSMNLGLNVAANIVAKKEINGKAYYSASCNADTPLEAITKLRAAEKKGRRVAVVSMVNDNLPFMYGDAVFEAEDVDVILDNPELSFDLFSAPKEPVTVQDHMIGLYASTLVKDGGTLQIGIGSLGDAVVCGLQARNDNNDQYKKLLSEIGAVEKNEQLIEAYGGLGTFDKGLYGSSEMFVDGFMHLYESGILKRKVYANAPLQKLINEGKVDENVSPEMIDLLVQEDAIRPQLSEKDFNFLQEFGIFKEELSYENGVIINGEQKYTADLSDETNKSEIFKNCLGKTLKKGILMTGAFFVGPEIFYESLRQLSDEERMHFEMTGVNVVNQLYGGETLRRLQRIHGRFINAGLIASIFGSVASDALENGSVISGIGGQYNFVSMAHALEDARSVMMIRSTRMAGLETQSNIVFNYGHCSVPKHLRDIVITEYGIADLRGRTDQDVVKAMLNVTDSRFQEALLEKAKKAGKVDASYEIPEPFRNNFPEKLEEIAAPYKEKGLFTIFPFGTSFTQEEIVLGKSLRGFKANIQGKKFKTILSLLKYATKPVPDAIQPYLERMQLGNPTSIKEKILRKVVAFAVDSAGVL